MKATIALAMLLAATAGAQDFTDIDNQLCWDGAGHASPTCNLGQADVRVGNYRETVFTFIDATIYPAHPHDGNVCEAKWTWCYDPANRSAVMSTNNLQSGFTCSSVEAPGACPSPGPTGWTRVDTKALGITPGVPLNLGPFSECSIEQTVLGNAPDPSTFASNGAAATRQWVGLNCEDELGDFITDPAVLVILPECSDMEDDDGDGLTDFPADPNCQSAADNREAPGGCGIGWELALVLGALRRRV